MNEVATVETALPAYLQDYQGPTGAEGIDTEDITIPRLVFAQALTPAVKDGKVKDGDIFLNITQETLAAKGDPLVIVPLITYKEYLLWKDRKDGGGGLLARATAVNLNGETKYAWDQPNTTFDNKIGGKKAVKWETGVYVDDDDRNLKVWGSSDPDDASSPPAASVHHNYIVRLPEFGNMIAAMSLSVTQVKRAKDFNAMLKLGTAPIWSRKFILSSEEDKSDSGEFFNVRFRTYGHVTEQEMAENEDVIKSFSNINVKFDQTNDSPDNKSTGADL